MFVALSSQIARLTWWTRYDKFADTDKMEEARDEEELKLHDVSPPKENDNQEGEEEELPSVDVEG